MNCIQVSYFISIIEVVILIALLGANQLPDILALLAGMVQLLTEIINLNILPSAFHLCERKNTQGY